MITIQQRNKPSKIIITIIFTSFLVIGYIIGGIIERDIQIKGIDELNKLTQLIADEIAHPLYLHLGKATIVTMVICIWCAFFATLKYVESIRNYMRNKEYGSDMWGDAKVISKLLSEKEPTHNKILSANARISINDEFTRLNGNTLWDGGSGSGKSAFAVTPNLHQLYGSYVVTDAKGDLLKKNGNYCKAHGMDVKVINFKRFKESDCYNPFHFVRSQEDIRKMITNLIANTTPKTATSTDPFWEKAESAYLEALASLVFYEGKQKNFPELLDYMAMSEVKDGDGKNKGNPSKLDEMIGEIEAINGPDHPAVKQYRAAFKGAADTIRSVIMCANSRLAFMNTPEIRRIMSKNDIEFSDLGFGKNKDGKTQTVLFFVIPANDKTYNSIIGMAYTQMFQELYLAAEDGTSNTRLKIPVQVWMDEFANISLPDEFENILATCRSYFISINIIIQNISQLKALFKDTWESVIGNCDTFVYLGGNEQSTHKYVSEMLGKWTIDKRNESRSYGKSNSYSNNEDKIGRELMTPTEVRKMKRNTCIVFVAGQDPIKDKKYKTFSSKKYKEAKKLGDYKAIKEKGCVKKIVRSGIKAITQDAYEFYRRCSENNDNIKIFEFDAKDIAKYMNTTDKVRSIELSKLSNAICKMNGNATDATDDNISANPGTGEKRKIIYNQSAVIEKEIESRTKDMDDVSIKNPIENQTVNEELNGKERLRRMVTMQQLSKLERSKKSNG